MVGSQEQRELYREAVVWHNPINHTVDGSKLTDFVADGLSRSSDVNMLTQLRDALNTHVKWSDIQSWFLMLSVSVQIKMWITYMIPKIEDGNNFGVSIQVDTDTRRYHLRVDTDSGRYHLQVDRTYR